MRPQSVLEDDFDYFVMEIPHAVTSYLRTLAEEIRLIAIEDSSTILIDHVIPEILTAFAYRMTDSRGQPVRKESAIESVVMLSCVDVVRAQALARQPSKREYIDLLAIYLFVCTDVCGLLEKIKKRIGAILREHYPNDNV